MPFRFFFLALCFLTFAPRIHAQNSPGSRLFAIREGKKWGFIDRSGKIVIAPRFDEVGDRSEAVWSVKSGKKWGFVAESSGQIALAPRFEAIGVWSEGLCAVVAGGKIGFIGKNGQFQIAPRFLARDNISSGVIESKFSGGLAPAQISETEAAKRGFKGTWGFIDRVGNWKITPRFSDAEPMSDGMARVSVLGRDFETTYGYASQTGKFVPLPQGASNVFSEPFYEGLAAIAGPASGKTARRLYGFLDKNGKWAIAPRFLDVLFSGDILEGRTGFKDGLATVVTGDSPQTVRLGWIGRDGKWAIEPRFNGGGAGFTEGLAPARIGEKMGEGKGGFIDKNGNFVVSAQFEKMGIFSDGLAPTQRAGEKWGYIDKNGAQIIAPRFDYVSLYEAITADMAALQFRDGLAFVKEGPVRGYVNQSGVFVWQEK